jgi:hypothetical protein
MEKQGLKVCPECHLKHEDTVAICDCGFDLGQVETQKRTPGPRPARMREGFDDPTAGVRVVEVLLGVAGWIVLIAALLTAIRFWQAAGPGSGIVALIGAFLSPLVFWGLWAIVRMLRLIESNHT